MRLELEMEGREIVYLWEVYTFSMEYPWSIHGLSMEYLCFFYTLFTDVTGKRYERQMGIIK
jgi:hypothetical protein